MAVSSKSEVSRSFFVVLDLALEDVASEGDEVCLGGVGQGAGGGEMDERREKEG
jgi:hypothetical protein